MSSTMRAFFERASDTCPSPEKYRLVRPKDEK